MRTIKRTTAFKKDFKKVFTTPRHTKDVDTLLLGALRLLVADASLPEHMRDHALIGDWKDYRECHLKPDLLLIYRTEEPNILRIVRLGSHSELFSR
jgi:mRNA interferase YafQ